MKAWPSRRSLCRGFLAPPPGLDYFALFTFGVRCWKRSSPLEVTDPTSLPPSQATIQAADML